MKLSDVISPGHLHFMKGGCRLRYIQRFVDPG